MTEKIYYEDVRETEFTATVLECRKEEKSGLYSVVLDRTAFFPEEGGQSADQGILDGQEVQDVRIGEDTIFHLVKEEISVGRKVTGKVDWDRRFDFMQQHTGEHLLSGTVHRHFGFDNVGFHLSDRETTMDFNGSVSAETLRDMEREVNEAIWKDLPVKIFYPDSSELEKLDYRSKLELTHDVRIVEIPGVDVCACCAPHVDSTGQIGMLKITNVQSYKGGVRLNIVCGKRALADYSEKEDSVAGISKLLSAKQNEVGDAVKKLMDKEKEDLLREGKLQKEYLALQMSGLPDPAGTEDVILFTGETDGNALREAVNTLTGKFKGICAVFSGSEDAGYRFALGSREKDCGALSADLRKQGFKGGGSERFIQGSVQKTEKEIRKILIGS